jgi:hypothetical protein
MNNIENEIRVKDQASQSRPAAMEATGLAKPFLPSAGIMPTENKKIPSRMVAMAKASLAGSSTVMI